MSGLFLNFYEDLLCCSNPTGISACLNALKIKVTEEMSANLTKDFVAEEVRAAIFQMNPMSSQGPDGFNAGFYQTHWHIVGQEFSISLIGFLNSTKGDMSLINDTYIVLIPKKSSKKVSDYRPISV